MFDIPVLMLVFNRPELTSRVFEAVRSVKLDKLFISADGPRADNPCDQSLCAQTRSIFDKIDWKCDVHLRYNDSNLGCRACVSSGIDWFFSGVDKGIILEDDCLPGKSFFHFCRHVLLRYENDTQVMHVNGSNFQGNSRTRHDYFFSPHVNIWGWATWKRAWEKYDVDMADYPSFAEDKQIERITPIAKMHRHWSGIFERSYAGRINTWDFQWQYAVFRHNGLAAVPKKNLILNTGFDTGSTHTTRPIPLIALLKSHEMQLTNPPDDKPRSDKYEHFMADEFYCPRNFSKWKRSLLKRLLPILLKKGNPHRL